MNAEFAKNAENPSEIQTRRSLRPRRSSSDADSLGPARRAVVNDARQAATDS
jgi:hypothetical protein